MTHSPLAYAHEEGRSFYFLGTLMTLKAGSAETNGQFSSRRGGDTGAAAATHDTGGNRAGLHRDGGGGDIAYSSATAHPHARRAGACDGNLGQI